MIEIKVGNDNIERALKRYKYKSRRLGLLQAIKANREYTKPSVRRRQAKAKAAMKYRWINDNQG